MKKQRVFTLMAMALVTVLLSAGLILAKSPKTDFECTSARNYSEPGTDFIQEHPADRYHIRDRLVIKLIDCDCDNKPDDDVSVWIEGDLHTSESGNLDMPAKQGGVGVFWGTFELFPDTLCTATAMFGTKEICIEGDGSWVGTYTRKLWEDTVVFSLDGHGTGVLEGLHIKQDDVHIRGNPPSPFNGYVLNPGGKWEPSDE